jgi:hypothetical protein
MAEPRGLHDQPPPRRRQLRPAEDELGAGIALPEARGEIGMQQQRATAIVESAGITSCAGSSTWKYVTSVRCSCTIVAPLSRQRTGIRTPSTNTA